MTTINHSSV